MTNSYKIIDALSGEATFKTSDQTLTYKLIIIGSPAANVKAFINDKNNGFNGWFIKINCSNWNGAEVKLYCKTNHLDDDFTDTGISFAADELQMFKYN